MGQSQLGTEGTWKRKQDSPGVKEGREGKREGGGKEGKGKEG